MSGAGHGGDAGGLPDLTFTLMLRKLAQRSSILMAPPITAQRSPAPLALMREGEARGRVVRSVFERARRLGLLEQAPGREGWRLSAKGREAVRRLNSESGEMADGARPPPSRPDVNLDESPLAWLRRRQGKDGAAMLSEAQFLAGERLRADFTYAQLGPRVTVNLDPASAAAGGGGRMSRGPADMADNVVAARERVNRALKAVGPELAGILLDVCCFLKGLKDAERSVGWPQRSGKVVLQLALSALARHYGIAEENAGAGAAERPRARHWGTADYRPTLDGAAHGAQPAAD